MKKLSLFVTILVVITSVLPGQENFQVLQLTHASSQEGFPSWSPKGDYVYYSSYSHEDTLLNNGIWKVSLECNTTEQVYHGLAEHPRLSPDGEYIVFDADSGRCIQVIPSNGGLGRTLTNEALQMKYGGMSCWSPDGSRIAFLEGGTMSIWVLCLKTGEMDKIYQEEGMVPTPGCWSPDGKSIFLVARKQQSRESVILKISSDGKTKVLIPGHHKGLYRYMAISPDGSMIIYSAIQERDIGLWLMPAEGGKTTQLISWQGYNESPAWSPDGKRIAFASTRTKNNIWVLEIDAQKIKTDLGIQY